MSNFDSTKLSLQSILTEIVLGKMQLPDFQRGWVWDDEHIRLSSCQYWQIISYRQYYVAGTGGTARFQVRPIEGVSLNGNDVKVENLILDGQQRLTSLTQVLKLNTPVKTRNTQKRELQRYYYINIEKAMEGNGSLEDAIIGVDETKQLKENFGRDVVLDLSTPDKEYKEFFFPCNQILNSDLWEEGSMAFDKDKFPRYMEFRKEVLGKFREYDVPIIRLMKRIAKRQSAWSL